MLKENDAEWRCIAVCKRDKICFSKDEMIEKESDHQNSEEGANEVQQRDCILECILLFTSQRDKTQCPT